MSLCWDLKMLQGLPNLKVLRCEGNYGLTGDLCSTRVLFTTLVELDESCCEEVTGSLEEMYDFPLLEVLNIFATQVVGDIRTICPKDFPKLKRLGVSDEVYGGAGQIMAIQDAPGVMFALHQLMKRFPDVLVLDLSLAYDSPEYYEPIEDHGPPPPFDMECVKAGPRMGWRWTNCYRGGACEIHWLDPEPSESEEGFDDYCDELELVDRDVYFYRGFLRPPTPEQYEQRNAQVPREL